MRISKKDGFLIAATLTFIACLLQSIGFIRYLYRLPDDFIGIGLYVAAIVAFAIATIGFLIQWRRLKSKD